jgi:hypothetical protein
MTLVSTSSVVAVGVGLALNVALSARQAPVQGPAAPQVQGTAPAPAPGGRGQGGPGAGGAGRGGGMGRGAAVPDDTTGFTEIFDGKTLTGWEGDPGFWRAENGTIVGESTPANRVAQNSFLIWRGGTVRDFELKLDFRINGTNSGIQYRSMQMPTGKWVLNGYQADLDFVNQFTGNTHSEGRGRFFLAQRGNIVRGTDGGGLKQVGTIDDPNSLKGSVNINGWNTYHIIARGQVILQLLNGRLMSAFIDEDTVNGAAEGLLGLQMHVGEPFKVEYRNLWLKQVK